MANEEVDRDQVVVNDDPAEDAGGDKLSDLPCRCSPKALVKVLADLNPMQKASVYEMGFGGLFDLQIVEVPSKLAHWCVKNFESVSCSIILKDGTKLRITEEDVWLIFGMPRGSMELGITPQPDVVDMWECRLGASKLTVKSLKEQIIKDETGGIWFKRAFMALVEICLIENTIDGRLAPKVFHTVQHLTRVRDYDWCGYILKALIRSHEMFARSKASRPSFTGPILLLVLIYTDRVVQYFRKAPRTFPIVKGWAWSKMRERQRLESEGSTFGTGAVEDRYMPSAREIQRIQTVEWVDDDLDDARYIGTVVSSAHQLTHTMSSFVKVASSAPDSVKSSHIFRTAVEYASKLMCQISSEHAADIDVLDVQSIRDKGLGELVKDVVSLRRSIGGQQWQRVLDEVSNTRTTADVRTGTSSGTRMGGRTATASTAADAGTFTQRNDGANVNSTVSNAENTRVDTTSPPIPDDDFEAPSFSIGLTQEERERRAAAARSQKKTSDSAPVVEKVAPKPKQTPSMRDRLIKIAQKKTSSRIQRKKLAHPDRTCQPEDKTSDDPSTDVEPVLTPTVPDPPHKVPDVSRPVIAEVPLTQVDARPKGGRIKVGARKRTKTNVERQKMASRDRDQHPDKSVGAGSLVTNIDEPDTGVIPTLTPAVLDPVTEVVL